MPLLVVALAVVLLLFLMTKLRLNGFIALFGVAVVVGLLRGMPLDKIYTSITDGVGGQLDETILTLGFGAMLGKVLADSGGADRIATGLIRRFGVSRAQLAISLTALCIGITMFYEVAFVLLIPLVFTLVRRHRMPLLWLGLPMSIILSTTHSFLPPHPGPTAVADAFHASAGLTLLYGLPIAVVAGGLVGYVWPRLGIARRLDPQIPSALTTTREFADAELPALGRCVVIIAVPVLMMTISAIAMLSLSVDSSGARVIEFFGEAPVALLVALVLAVVLLGGNIARLRESEAEAARRAELSARPAAALDLAGGALSGSIGSGTTSGDRLWAAESSAAYPTGGTGERVSRVSLTDRFQAAMDSCGESLKPMAMIIAVIGAGGAFKQVLVDSGIADYVAHLTHGWDISPLLLAWIIAAFIRAAVGSATVAVVTAAGIVAPLLGSGVSPELLVLSVTCGSICFSHVNDPGFWLFKEYLNLSLVDTLKLRTTYETAVGVIGLLGVLALGQFV